MSIELSFKQTGNGPPILLIPGFGFAPTCFALFEELLSVKFECHRVMIPWFNQCHEPQAQLDDLVDQLNDYVSQGMRVLGWSLGGNIAVSFAKKYPEKVSKLVLLATNPLFIKTNNWPGLERSEFEKFACLASTDLKAALKQFCFLQLAEGQTSIKKYQSISQMCLKTSQKSLPTHNFLNLLAWIDQRKSLSEICSNTHWIFGQRDQLVPINVVEKLAEILPSNHAIHILEQAGHYVDHNKTCLYLF